MAKRGFGAVSRSKGGRKFAGANKLASNRKAASLGKVASFKERGGYGLRSK